MNNFFTIIYIKTNRLSDERIAIGLLANINGLPEFYFSDRKLNFALKFLKSDQSRAIKKSLYLLSSDVNKYVNGETSIPMFDEPYAKKILSKLVLKKRGLLYFGDLIEIEKPISYQLLYKKYISDEPYLQLAKKEVKVETFKRKFNSYTNQKRFNSFARKQWLNDSEFPLLTAPVQVDLYRKKSGLTVFKSIDFNLSEKSIQQHIATFRMLVESLNEYSTLNGLSKGRYYLVFESPKDKSKAVLADRIQTTYKKFELIKMSEMADKI